MVLYSKLTYGSQFSGEKKQFKNPMLGCRIICKINTAPFFFKHPVCIFVYADNLFDKKM